MHIVAGLCHIAYIFGYISESFSLFGAQAFVGVSLDCNQAKKNTLKVKKILIIIQFNVGLQCKPTGPTPLTDRKHY